jgi:hypothetical protein
MNKVRRCVVFTVGAVVVLLIGTVAQAQQNVGSIKGTVEDPSGGAIPSAVVVARDQATGVGRKTVTNKAGAYSFPQLDIGLYTLTVSAPGFKTTERSDIHVIAGLALTFDIQLILGQVSQVVSVTAQAVNVDTTSTNMGSTTRTSEDIHNMPLQLSGSARSSLNFLRMLSTLTYDPTAQDSSIYNSAAIEGSNGFNAVNFASYSIDGVTASSIMFVQPQEYNPLVPDLISEVRLASNFDAEKGWNSGVGIELVTKSGTNQFHGSAFEYVRNTSLDSRSFFASKVSPTHQNEFGFILGGPIIKNKTFFMGSYDGFRFITQQTGVIATVPTAAMRVGDFSQFLGAQKGTDALGRPIYQNEIYDPDTTRPDGSGGFIRDPFMYNGQLNVIPASRFSSVSQAFQQGYPLPTLPGTQLNWVGSNARAPYNIDKFSIKVDQQFGDRHHLSIGYDQSLRDDRVNAGPAFAPVLQGTQKNNQNQYRPRITYTWIAKPNLLLNLRFGMTYEDRFLGTFGLPSATGGAAAGLKGVVTPNTPTVSIQNASGFGYPFLVLHDPHIPVPVSGSVTWTRGKHNVKLGGEFLRHQGPFYNTQNSAGNFSFASRITGFPNLTGTGVGYAGFLLGDVDNATLNTIRNTRLIDRGWALYAQDQWRIAPKWTVNYGLRWNAAQPSWDLHDEFGAFSPTIPNPLAGGRLGAITFWGEGAGRNGLHYSVDPNYAMFEPRLGIAYAPNSQTAIRVYYGIVHSASFAQGNDGTIMNSYGWTATVARSTLDNGLTPAFNWDNGYPPIPTLPNLDPSFLNGSSVSQVDPKVTVADTTQAFGLSVERSMGHNLIVRGEYIGKLTHGISLGNTFAVPVDVLDPKYFSLGNLLTANIYSPQAVAAGIPVPYAGFQGSVAQALLPFPQYSGVTQANNRGGFSEYNAGHFALEKRVSIGLSFLVDYTISKQLYSGPFQHLTLQNSWKAISPTDRPQSFAVSYDYELPFGRGKPFLNNAGGFIDRVAGGWEVAGIHNYFSGQVINVSTEATIPGVGGVWANRAVGVPISTGIGCSGYQPGDPSSRFLNVAAFSTPAPFTFGNTRTLSNVRGCPYAVENVSLIKRIPVSERIQFKLAANAFNMLNRHYWTGLSSDINNLATFGRFSGATSPRSIQLAVKVEF